MSEQEIRVGQSEQFVIAGKTLTVKPVPLGRMKKAMAIFSEKGVDDMEKIARYLESILVGNEGITMDWILENITWPQANELLTVIRQINGLGNVFPGGAAADIKTERPLVETMPPTPSV